MTLDITLMLQERGSRVSVTGFGKPNKMYDAVLPLRLLLLKLWDKKVYRLVSARGEEGGQMVGNG